MKRVVCVLACVLLLTCLVLPAAAGDQELGQRLVGKMFALMKANDIPALDKLMAPGFQSVHSDGARTRAKELALIKKLKLGDYRLADFKTTRQGQVLVVTYTVSVAETIDAKRTNTVPAPRLSVFVKDKGQWLWLAHANLKPVGKK